MVYNERYNIPWYSKTNSGYVYIDQLDATTASERLTLAYNGIILDYVFDGWNEPVIGQNAQINIINTKDNFFDLLPLLTNEEREYRIRIVETNPSTYTFFEGFLNADNNEQIYLHNQSIRLTASNYVNKLSNYSPTIVDVLDRRTPIDFIIESLKLTGKDSSIYINMNVCPSGYSISTNQTTLNISAIDTEIFWQNNIERDSGLEILKKILVPFDSYLYWWNGKWYIERYEDLYKYPQHYVAYKLDVSYGYAGTGTAKYEYDVSKNIFSYTHLGKSQTLSIIPGLNKIEIRLNPVEYNSLVDNYWDPIVDTSLASKLPLPYGSWVFWKEDSEYYINYGNYNGITNTFLRSLYPSDEDWEKGAWTSFKVSVDPSSIGSTSLTLKWKWIPGPADAPAFHASELNYHLPYYIEIRDHESMGGLYYKYDSTAGVWYTTNDDTPEQVTIIEGDLDKATLMYQMSVTIPMSDVSDAYFTSLSGNYTLIFGIPMARRFYTGYPLTTLEICLNEYIGDISVTTDQSEQDNLITGTISNKFLNTKTIELDLYDIQNLNYKNGFFIGGSTFPTRSTYWYDDSSTYLSITDRLINSKFKLYNKSRQQISSTVITSDFLKPFTPWYDSNQSGKKFILTGYTYRPTRNEYDCIWNEFDVDTSLNLNEA